MNQPQNPQLNAYDHIYGHRRRSTVRYWYGGFGILVLLALFLPWTQTVRARGNVIARMQEQRVQEVNTIIAGRIVKWHVKEGDFVQAGDTLVQLSEVKEAYLDPELLGRTREQIEAKQEGIVIYRNKAEASASQQEALRMSLQVKQEQLRNKLQQLRLKAQSDSMEALAAVNELSIAQKQYSRQRSLFDSGLVSLTALETRNQAYQNATAKRISAENKYLNTRQELGIVQLQINEAEQEYLEKSSKAESERLGSLSEAANGAGEVAKLRNQYSSYSIRNGWYVVLAPQSGQVVRARKSGIGEVVKESEMLVQIVPDRAQYAVELFVRPVDLPLVAEGQHVQFLFDGFPAIVFSGWPEASYGTFTGKVVAVETAVSENGRFRVLVTEVPGKKQWPPNLKMGTGANGLALLSEVPVWYELWRNINSFPPDYYTAPKTAKK